MSQIDKVSSYTRICFPTYNTIIDPFLKICEYSVIFVAVASNTTAAYHHWLMCLKKDFVLIPDKDLFSSSETYRTHVFMNKIGANVNHRVLFALSFVS